jgi:hypothetical protein
MSGRLSGTNGFDCEDPMKKLFLTLALANLLGAPAHAGPWPEPDSALDLSGFGTFGLASTNTDAAQFIRYNQARGATSGVTSGTDSNLGLQAMYKFSPAVSATVQTLTRKYTQPRYTTDLSWAFLSIVPAPEWQLRLGRVVVPAFMTSDYQNIGYANTMMRPPMELYALAPLENADGADLLYRHAVGAGGETSMSAQLTAGVSRGQIVVSGVGGTVVHYRAPLWALNLALEHGPFMLRFGRLRANFGSSDFGALNDVAAQLDNAGYGQLARDLTTVGGKQIDFTSLGLTMDWNNIVLQSEVGRRRAAEPVYISNNDAWYLMAGYRFGHVLPYYAHAAVRQAGRSVVLPPGFGNLGALASAVDAGFLTSPEQHSDLVGVRWNFAKSRALTIQVDRLRPTAKNGELIFGPPGGLHAPVMVTAVALDFVF